MTSRPVREYQQRREKDDGPNQQLILVKRVRYAQHSESVLIHQYYAKRTGHVRCRHAPKLEKHPKAAICIQQHGQCEHQKQESTECFIVRNENDEFSDGLTLYYHVEYLNTHSNQKRNVKCYCLWLNHIIVYC